MIKYYCIGIITLLLLLVISCKSKTSKNPLQAKEDSIADAMQWKPIRDGLFLSRFGDVGFKTAYHINEYEVIETYKTGFCCEDNKAFKDVIDIKTFKQIGGDWGWGGYFKDKNYIYHFFGNSDGGNLSIVDEADHDSFEIVSDCYGRDKSHIYDMRFGAMDSIESEKFKIIYHKKRCWGKYNGNYYEGNQKLSIEDLANPEIQKTIKLLDKL